MSYNLSTAYLSSLIYKEDQVNRNTNGATFTDPLNNTWVQKNYVDEPDGYQGAVFVNAQTKQVVMVNRGTEPNWADAYADLQMGIALVPDQFVSAQKLLESAQKFATDQGLSANDVLVTGHSLGGALAQLIAASAGLAAETYNAYGAGNLLAQLGIVAKPYDNIKNHVTEGDPVSVLAGSKMIGKTLAYASDAVVDIWSRGILPGYAQYLANEHGISNFLGTGLQDQAGRPVTIDIPGTAAAAAAWNEHMRDGFLSDLGKRLDDAVQSTSDTLDALTSLPQETRDFIGTGLDQLAQKAQGLLNQIDRGAADFADQASSVFDAVSKDLGVFGGQVFNYRLQLRSHHGTPTPTRIRTRPVPRHFPGRQARGHLPRRCRPTGLAVSAGPSVQAL